MERTPTPIRFNEEERKDLEQLKKFYGLSAGAVVRMLVRAEAKTLRTKKKKPAKRQPRSCEPILVGPGKDNYGEGWFGEKKK